ncbi:MAG: radical SAM protein [Planctomycetaceae bacterium]
MQFSDEQIIAARGARSIPAPWRPYHFLAEEERTATGLIEDVATIFLTNRECPFRCLMCDLWKNTTTETVPLGAIPAQIEFALQQLPSCKHIKLYNSGNFFDAKAIPRADHPLIAAQVSHFQTVIVENHPRLCSQQCGEFQKLCGTQLEVAMGLETSNKSTLATLNKQMTTDDFARACELLQRDQIRLRSFVLLRPPGLTEEQGIEQSIESVRFAFDCGVQCCAIIPTRKGNGILDRLEKGGLFASPSLRSLERVFNECLSWNRGRVFVDLWDIERFASCHECLPARIHRLHQMNLHQQLRPPVVCGYCP